MTYFQRLVVNTMAFISLSVLFPSYIYVSSFLVAILASFVLSILNMLVKPILYILSLPITILTLGLFGFVINAVILKWTSLLVGETNFAFSSFWATLFISLILSFINSIVGDHQRSRGRGR